MSRPRVFIIGLDGFEVSLADRFMAEGDMPALKAFQARSARLLLNHGSAKRTGLAWEHVSAGLAPGEGGRWSAVDFDPIRYSVSQRSTEMLPFVHGLSARTVVFDAPYFDLRRAENLRGAVNWGAHDPGVPAASRPEALNAEIAERFGPYPAEPWIYGFVWPSPDKTKRMSADLVEAIDLRTKISSWLFAERLPDWDLGLVVVSELHSAAEALWHGVDPDHPLHAHPSAFEAGKGLRAAYAATDRLIGDLTRTFQDATVLIFNLHGMGANDSDPSSMLLLAELMYRYSFHENLLPETQWPVNDRGAPLFEEKSWDRTMAKLVSNSARGGKLKNGVKKITDFLPFFSTSSEAAETSEEDLPLEWMAAARYRKHWRRMKAFALPSFYDGRIRINLAGREGEGRVALEDYHAICDDIENVLRTCRDVRTGRPVAHGVERHSGDPRLLDKADADMTITWNAPLGFQHPVYGTIGPVPYRRTGGHTGEHGVAYFAGKEIASGELGETDAFDVVPTIVDLLGEVHPGPLSGKSLLERLRKTV